jgi:hypothetical protein
VYPDGAGLLFGCSPTAVNLNTLHPNPDQIRKLWKAYQENVGPLVNVLHDPSMQQCILEATTDLTTIPKSLHALLFAVYLGAAISFQDGECEKILGENRSTVQSKYLAATQHALIQANLLKSSDLVVLQAFVIFLVS